MTSAEVVSLLLAHTQEVADILMFPLALIFALSIFVGGIGYIAFKKSIFGMILFEAVYFAIAILALPFLLTILI